MIRSGPVSLGGDSEEKGAYLGRHPCWGVSGESHRLGSPALGCYVVEDEPAWLVGGLLGVTGGLWEDWIPLVRSMHVLAHPPRQGSERSALADGRFPVTTSVCTPALAKRMLQPRLLHVTV